ncbi:MAG: type I restriction enzyme HsdR N-terminal domain-containing protein [Paludibacter sp.]|nr:type I restriction enzyme HsdR N-terminal domain-containing protein [Paludibacter sp.]
MLQLNLPPYDFNIKKQNDNVMIFDCFRNRFVVLTPEEWVRQNFLQYLLVEKKFPKSLMAVEKMLLVNGTRKRFDALVYNKQAVPIMILEFKAPNVAISQKVFDQAAVYNHVVKAKFMIASNGMEHYFCEIKSDGTGYDFKNEIPNFIEVCQ